MIAWTAAVLSVTLPGLAFARRADPATRAAIAFTSGSVIVTTLMFAADVVGIPWNRWWIGSFIVVAAAAGIALRGEEKRRTKADPITTSVIAFFCAATAWGVLTARETCADLVYFWGTKAARFAEVGGIDIAFLAHPEHHLMHSDYPPLLPLLYAWGALAAGEWTLWGPLLLTPFLLGATALVTRTFVSDSAAMVMAGVLAFGFAQALAAGAAEPMLLLFEVVALCALLRDEAALASFALSGAVMTKVEGAAFAVVTLIAYTVVSRRIGRSAAIAAAPALLLAAWIFFASQNGILDTYSWGTAPLYLEAFPALLRKLTSAASYNAFYLPWVAAAALLFVRGTNLRRAAMPLLVAAGSIAYTFFFYLHAKDASQWITWSAERVLLTPLVALVVASGAAAEGEAVATPSAIRVESPLDGVVPQREEAEGSE